MPYLIINSDEILKGEDIYPSDEDILLETYDSGGFRVFKNGRLVILKLQELTENLGYEIILHSKSNQQEQGISLRNLQAACSRHELNFPRIRAIACCDPTSAAKTPLITSENGILMITWSENTLANNPSQQILEEALSITAQNRHEHIVLETNEVDFEAARNEGYQGYLLGNTLLSFDVLLDQIADVARQKIAGAEKDASGEGTLAHSASSSFFSAPRSDFYLADISVASNLTEDQQAQILNMVTRLQKVIQSCWPYPHKTRKRTKIEALQSFNNLCASMEISEAVAKIQEEFPDVCQGEVGILLRSFSRTLEMLV